MAVELASGYVSLVPAFDRGKLRSETRALEDQLERAGGDGGRRAGDGFAGAFGAGIKRAIGAAAVAFAGLQVGQFFGDAIGAASDLGETTSKVAQIFGRDALPALEEFASAAAKSMGQSERSALDAAATFGVFGKSAGLTGRDLAGFSTEMVTLASDLASFGNTSPEEAIEAIGAALRGESEPIRRYGVLLDEATLRNRALALGLIATTKEALTPQQKVLAAQAEILAQTSDAQGDFARTSDGLANQQRILRAELENSKAALGEALLPAATAVVSFLVDKGIPGFRDFAGGVRDALAAFAESDAAQGALQFLRDNGPVAFDAVRSAAAAARDVLVEVFEFVAEHQDAFSVAAGGALGFAGALAAIAGAQQAVGAVSALGSSAGLLGRALPLLLTPVGLIAGLVVGLGVAAFVAYKKFEPFRDVVDAVARVVRDVAVAAFERLKPVLEQAGPAFDKVKDALGGVKDVVVTAATGFAGFVQGVRDGLGPLVDWFQAHVVPTLAAGWDLFAAATTRVGEVLGAFLVAAQTVFSALLVVAGPVFDALGSAFSTFVAVVRPVWDGFWAAVQTVASAVFDAVRVVVETVLGVIRGVFQQVTGLIDGDWSKFWEGVRTVADSVLGAIKGLVDAGLDAVKGVFSAAFDAVKATVSSALGEVVGLVGGLAGRAVAAAGNLLGALAQKGRDLIQGVIDGIGSMWGALSASLAGIPGRVAGAVGDLSWVLYDAGWSIIQGLIDGIRDAIPGVRSVLGSVTGLIPDWKGPADVDRRLLEPSGKLILQGLMAGIAAQVPALRVQLAAVTTVIERGVADAPKVRSLAAPPPPAVSGRAAGTETIVVPVYLDRNKIAEAQVRRERSMK